MNSENVKQSLGKMNSLNIADKSMSYVLAYLFRQLETIQRWTLIFTRPIENVTTINDISYFSHHRPFLSITVVNIIINNN